MMSTTMALHFSTLEMSSQARSVEFRSVALATILWISPGKSIIKAGHRWTLLFLGTSQTASTSDKVCAVILNNVCQVLELESTLLDNSL